jgi:hypothetical protein
MSGHSTYRRASNMTGQAGTAAIEFSLIVLVFLVFICGVMELARSMYIFNTLQEVTRRAAFAAANADFSAESSQQIRRAAIFRAASDTGGLLFGAPITAEHIRIDYMALERVGNETVPKLIPIVSVQASSPEENRVLCLKNVNDVNCVRLIRVQVCMPGTDCESVPYQTLFPLISLPLSLPFSRSIVAAETLGLSNR